MRLLQLSNCGLEEFGPWNSAWYAHHMIVAFTASDSLLDMTQDFPSTPFSPYYRLAEFLMPVLRSHVPSIACRYSRHVALSLHILFAMHFHGFSYITHSKELYTISSDLPPEFYRFSFTKNSLHKSSSSPLIYDV